MSHENELVQSHSFPTVRSSSLIARHTGNLLPLFIT